MQSVHSTAPADWVLVGRVLPLCRDAIGIFYSSRRLGPRWESLAPLQRYNRCILLLQLIGPSLGESCPSAGMQSVYSTAPADLVLVGRVLPLCSDAIVVFYCSSRLGSRWESLAPLQRCNGCILQLQPIGPSLGEFCLSVEMQSVYSTVSTDWVRGL